MPTCQKDVEEEKSLKNGPIKTPEINATNDE